MQLGNVFDGWLLATLATCLVVWPTQWITDAQNRWLRIFSVGLVALQLIFDGPRIQLLPAYLIGGLFAVLLILWQLSDGKASAVREEKAGLLKRLIKWAMISSVAVVLLLSALLCVLFPRYRYPAPSGQFAVGVQELHLIDPSRLETETPDPNDRRELRIKVSYPADAAIDSSSFKRDRVEDRIAIAAHYAMMFLSRDDGLVNAVPHSWGRIATNAWTDAPITSAGPNFPVLIYSHGLGSWPEQNTVLIEELASRGYIVFAINHAGFSSGMTRLDGSTFSIREFMARSNAAAAAAPNSDAIRERSREIAQALNDEALAVDVRAKIIKERSALRPGPVEVTADAHRLVADDQRFVLDYLQSGDALFRNRLDLNRTGVFGMSTGGTASHLTCSKDQRCRAGLNMDGFQAVLVDVPLTVPFMHMSNAKFFSHAVTYEQSSGPSYLLRVAGSAHGSFTDIVYTTPMARQLDKRGIDVIGSIDGARMLQIMNEYVLAFFDKHLRETNQPLLDGPSDRFAEVTLLSK